MQALHRTRNLLAEPTRWIQHAEQKGDSYCLWEALRVSSAPRELCAAAAALSSVIPKMPGRRPVPVAMEEAQWNIIVFNDAPSRKHADVIEVIDAAISATASAAE